MSFCGIFLILAAVVWHSGAVDMLLRTEATRRVVPRHLLETLDSFSEMVTSSMKVGSSNLLWHAPSHLLSPGQLPSVPRWWPIFSTLSSLSVLFTRWYVDPSLLNFFVKCSCRTTSFPHRFPIFKQHFRLPTHFGRTMDSFPTLLLIPSLALEPLILPDLVLST